MVLVLRPDQLRLIPGHFDCPVIEAVETLGGFQCGKHVFDAGEFLTDFPGLGAVGLFEDVELLPVGEAQGPELFVSEKPQGGLKGGVGGGGQQIGRAHV